MIDAELLIPESLIRMTQIQFKTYQVHINPCVAIWCMPSDVLLDAGVGSGADNTELFEDLSHLHTTWYVHNTMS